MHQAVEQGRDHADIAEQRSPVVERSIGRDNRRSLLIAAHQPVGESIAGGGGQFADEQVVDDQEIGAVELRTVFA